jgi:SulP family sulfate permease
MKWTKYLPVTEWIGDYNGATFQHDFIAGLTVCVILIPQGMAYALLAGMPPIYGLYGGLIPLFLYGIFGTSRQLSIGPVAISALLVLAGINQLAEPGSPEYVSLVITTGLLVGFMQMLLSFMRLGFLVNFLSHPVIVGFTSAAAIIIAISQLKYLLGIPIPRFSHAYETVGYAIEHISEIHWLSFSICVGGVILMLILRRISRTIPSALIITIVGILVVWLLGLDEQGVNIVGEVPRGLPAFEVPGMDMATIREVFPTVLTVTVIGIVESIGIAKVLEAKHRSYRVRPNQELFALGISKIGGAFFQSLPTSGSFTRSAINNEAGAKTGMASIITAAGVALTLIFLTQLFFYLPEAALASIILVAVKGLFDLPEAIHLWKTHRQDFAMMLITFLLTLALGIEEGVLVGVILSLLMTIYRTATPHIAVLGKIPNTYHYRNTTRFPEAIQHDDILILRFDAPLFFGNANYFKDTIRSMVGDQDDKPRLVILDASSISDVDSTGLNAVEELNTHLEEQGVEFYLSGAIGPVRDLLHQAGIMEQIGEKNQFMYVNDAVRYFKQHEDNEDIEWTSNAIQTNVKKGKK